MSGAPMHGRVLSVQVGGARPLDVSGRRVLSGIRKQSVDGRVAVRSLGLEGLLETDVCVGDRLCFPDCVLRVTQPRAPCCKFDAVMALFKSGRRRAV
jgi:MOSC domain-containing protein YiiM